MKISGITFKFLYAIMCFVIIFSLYAYIITIFSLYLTMLVRFNSCNVYILSIMYVCILIYRCRWYSKLSKYSWSVIAFFVNIIVVVCIPMSLQSIVHTWHWYKIWSQLDSHLYYSYRFKNEVSIDILEVGVCDKSGKKNIQFNRVTWLKSQPLVTLRLGSIWLKEN